MSIKNVVLGMAVLGSVMGGGLAVDAATAPEANAACYGSVSTFKGKNNSCSRGARHWDVIKGKDTAYGNWADRGSWSSQRACWINVVSYGMTAR
ncbi:MULTISPECIES: hypothetical protein [unclassified Curtobacterium]|uniref:hypothetical protein n=1 Tax=unclassified Curtobacterium TaxID=257496 RepID=UPI0008DE8B9D|nr:MULTISPECIES: hypothetical protein [unclassified Curtobacterium]OIH98252.1 hypothetical protein BIU92_14475 [Curtobacterium sp. MCBA15_003]OII15835.1 hypothetical protein BIU97_14330 [Curtobacterium sp. MCBA15_009]OII31277.1 hypothetical protein BIU94_04725 [Curtobacterium sp. MMLR14_006]